MYAPIHANRPPLQVLAKIKTSFERGDYFTLQEVHKIQWDEIENLYRLFREKEAEGKGGGGGIAGENKLPQPTQKVSAVANVIFETVKMGMKDDEIDIQWFPSIPVVWRLWDDTSVRLYKSVNEPVTLTQIVGHLWIQADSAGLPPEQHYITMNLESGGAQISKDNLLGFNVGFEREMAGANKGRFFMDVFEFSPEANTKPTQLIREDPISSRKFRSLSAILDDTILAEYDMSTGGGGIRFKCDLTLFGR